MGRTRGIGGPSCIIILALCVMVDAVKPSETSRDLGVIVGAVTLLIMPPNMIAELRNTMSFGQELGIITS